MSLDLQAYLSKQNYLPKKNCLSKLPAGLLFAESNYIIGIFSGDNSTWGNSGCGSFS